MELSKAISMTDWPRKYIPREESLLWMKENWSRASKQARAKFSLNCTDACWEILPADSTAQ